MRVLVAYGTKRGGTEGIADEVGAVLRDRGLDVAVRPVEAVHHRNCDEYDAFIVGAALYMGRWHRGARHLVRRCAKDMRGHPVWLFSSGPLDDSAEDHDIEPVHQVRKLMARVGARGHVTFGGRLEADAHGFPASAMAKTMSGDHRDHEHIDAWANRVADQLETYRNLPASPADSR